MYKEPKIKDCILDVVDLESIERVAMARAAAGNLSMEHYVYTLHDLNVYAALHDLDYGTSVAERILNSKENI